MEVFFRRAEKPVEFVPNPSAVLVYTFHEGTVSGNKVYDLSGNGNEAKIVGNVHWVTGKFGKALQIDPSISTTCVNQGTGILLDNPSNELKTLGNNEYAIFMWINFNGYNGNTWIHIRTNYNCPGWNGIWLHGSSSRIYVDLCRDIGGQIYYRDYAFSPSEWHSILFYFSRKEGKIRIFVDGKEITPAASISGNYGTFQKIRIGMYETTCEDAFSGGSIDQVMIFNKAITPDEIYWMKAE